MALIDLDSILHVASAFQNEDHRAQAHLLNLAVDALTSNAPPDEVQHRVDALALHTRNQFLREDTAMQRTGFPPALLHLAEHERVLVEFDQQLDAWREEGDGVRLLAWLSRDVPAWFVTHVGTMDSVSAQWLASHGG